MPVTVNTLVLGRLETNCYIVTDGKVCAVIDPASPDRRLPEAVAATGCELRYILLTHGHFDHIGGIDILKKEHPDAKLVVNVGDADMITNSRKNYSISVGEPYRAPEADAVLTDGAVLPFGQTEFTMLHTPGHSPGSCCYRIENLLFCGDTVFCDGFGRTDLWGGNSDELKVSVSRIFMLPPSTELLPGHGEKTTVRCEIAGYRR